jgi:hypothetical protein
VPLIPATVAVAVDVAYLRLIDDQGNEPVAWFVVGLVVAATAALYGAWRDAPQRRSALNASGIILVVLGLLGMMSVGLPLLVAAVVVFYAGTHPGR